LELLVGEAVEQVGVARVLEPLYQTDQEWERLVRIYEVQLERIEDPTERLSLVQRIADLCEKRLIDQPQAFVWWGRAFREQPLSELAVEEGERLARATPSWGGVGGTYVEGAANAADTPG